MLSRIECAILMFVEQMIEVPGRALLDLLDLVETSEDYMRGADVPPALIDALHGAAEAVKLHVFSYA
ncbi:MAG: hypothetical protein KJN63_10605 [Acidimicrobiia bacterium]|nr:hypothetical protein [Acidimicrobiia bacterium]